MKRKPYFYAIVYDWNMSPPTAVGYVDKIDILKDTLKELDFYVADIFIAYKPGKEHNTHSTRLLENILSKELDLLDTLKHCEEIRL